MADHYTKQLTPTLFYRHIDYIMGHVPPSYSPVFKSTFYGIRPLIWGQKIKVFADHKNLVRDALGLSSNRVFSWRLTLEEYNPKIYLY